MRPFSWLEGCMIPSLPRSSRAGGCRVLGMVVMVPVGLASGRRVDKHRLL